jgi:cyclic beta-1,2-glucan synthetase
MQRLPHADPPPVDLPHAPWRPDTVPRTHLLSNGRYAVMLTDAGSGYSRWRDMAVSRWIEDVTCDGWGSYIFLRDAATGATWSAGYQPLGTRAAEYEVAFSPGRARIMRRNGRLITTMEVAVAADDDGEVRRVSVANDSPVACEIDLTTYAELVLASAAGDAAHPAFSKLFVQTEFLGERGVVLATRRRRSPDEAEIWAAHLAVVDGVTVGALQCETDRARFLGRGQTLRSPGAISRDAALSGTVGTVLDPIFSLRQRVRIEPGGSARVSFWTVVASSRDAVLALAEKRRGASDGESVFAEAEQSAKVELERLGVSDDEALLFQRLAGALIYSDAGLRSPPEVLMQGIGGPPTLWACGISGDRPIALVRIQSDASLNLVRQSLCAHAWWASQGLAADLVVVNEASPTGASALQTALEGLVPLQKAIFLLRGDQLDGRIRAGLLTAARIVLSGDRGDIAAQFRPSQLAVASSIALAEPETAAPEVSARAPRVSVVTTDLEFFNGLGGFADGGREYVIVLPSGKSTPAPWLNVIANPEFGFSATAEGGGHTWAVNSQQNPQTPWGNDPVSDAPSEAIYLRDRDSGELWTPTALPVRAPGSVYVARHGKGYSRFEHTAHGIEAQLLQYVPVADAIKISRLKVRNRSRVPRRLSVTAYVQWALGANGTQPAPFVVTRQHATTGALLAQNRWRPEFGECVSFMDLCGKQRSLTGDRTEFLGRTGALARPLALTEDAPLSGRVGAGLDPCGALQTHIELEPDAEVEVVLLLGEAADEAGAQALIEHYRRADLDAVLEQVATQWGDVLAGVQVRTPNRAMDVMLNHQLLYQTLACRVWARTAFYQASGAYGFRDQLQDVMALSISRPDVTRAQVLLAAARQFIEGDVQHWWLPPSGKGIRTRMTDDRLWLSYVTAQYIGVSADAAVLDEIVPFLEGEPLKPGQNEMFSLSRIAAEPGSLYEHCARALDVSLSLGAHGLPLIGTGDWNDGMNRVGEEGRGESVWLGWFLLATIDAFAPYAEARREGARVARWRRCAATVRSALETAGWDGRWYRRGYYDDGTPLGSNESAECKIDTIAQSWSVMSGVADPAHAAQAMAAVDERLIRREDEVALLLAPPFDRTPLDPGYIKGYPPGIRENGGQYTHGAVWSIFAFAMLGQGDKASALFDILNPIRHSDTPDALARYRVEPYVSCSDVYSVAPHIGRGGWTWYTGSAGWLYRAGIEAILGLQVRGDHLLIDPCIPKAWPGYEIAFRRRGPQSRATSYQIAIENPHGVSRGIASATLDGKPLDVTDRKARVALVNDGETHRAHIVLG